MENILKSIKEEKSLSLNENELKKLSDYMDNLKSLSADGEKYRTSLIANARKSLALTLPALEGKAVDEILKSISTDTLESLCNSLEKQVKEKLPPVSQLYAEDKKNNNTNNEFKF